MASVMSEPVRADEVAAEAAAVVERWLAAFNVALEARDARALGALFRPDAHLRDIAALEWRLETVSDHAAIVARVLAAATGKGLRAFAVDPKRVPPWAFECAGDPVYEALIRFETAVGTGEGHLRIKCADAQAAGRGAPPAWTLVTALASLRDHDIDAERRRREEPVFERDWLGPNWADRRRAAVRYADRDPAVLIVGGGHSGIVAATELKALNVDALVVDRHERPGDVWRKRYHGLKLHSPAESTHMPYLPFPRPWPKYIPKDKLANYLENYVDSMEVDYWPRTDFQGARWDAQAGCWVARLALADGSIREMRPRHIVMATGVAARPNMPQIPTLEHFAGTVVHSSQFANGAAWAGKRAYVFGTGTSAHDIAQDLHANGAQVTIVQRSPTVVVNIEPSAHLYLDVLYLGEGPPLADRDLIACSFPAPIMRKSFKLTTQEVKKHDAAMLAGLERAGFRVDFGEDDTGWAMKFLEYAGGYYFNVGGSDLIIDGKVKVLQADAIAGFDAAGLVLKDGTSRPADLLVFATGYKPYADVLTGLFGEDVARRVGPVWGLRNPAQELGNMWTPTAQPGLWFTGGSFIHARIYSKYLAVQIKAAELGLTRA